VRLCVLCVLARACIHTIFALSTNCNRTELHSEWHFSLLHTTLCLKKVPTFTLYVTLSNLNRFSKFLQHWKVHEICYKTYDIVHLTLGMLLQYLEK